MANIAYDNPKGASPFMGFADAPSRLAFHIRIAVLSALALGFAVLFASEVYAPPTIAPALLLLLIGYLRFFNEAPPFLPFKIWSLLTSLLVLGLFALSLIGYLFFLTALDIIFFAIPFIKLLTAKSERDYLQIYAIAFAQIIYGTIVNDQLSFGIVLGLYAGVAMWGLILLSFHASAAKILLVKDASMQNVAHAFNNRYTKEIDAAVFRSRFLIFVAGLAPLVVLLTFILFFIVPRPGSTLFRLSFGIDKRKAGFSEKVEIGDVGEIMLDESVALRVETFGEIPPTPIYWRGVVHDKFDGIRWRKRNLNPMPLEKVNKGYFRLAERKKGSLFEHRVYTVGVDTKFLIHAGFFAEAYVEGADRLFLHHTGAITLPDESQSFNGYRVWSAGGGYFSYPDKLLKRFLQLPKIDHRVLTLANEITKNAGTNREKAIALERYLKDNFAYSLQSGIVPSADPLVDFLFNNKAGHCEYFATAMAVMLRVLNVPSRLATGFIGGEYNEEQRYFIVRQSNAHAWVEAYLDDRWVRFDPTPEGGLPKPKTGILASMKRLADELSFRWQRYVVNFTAKDQIDAMLSFQRALRNTEKPETKASLKRYAKVVFTVFIALLALILLYANRKELARLFSRKKTTPREKASKHFQAMAKLLASHKIKHETSMTPKEFIQSAIICLPTQTKLLKRWLYNYERLRYSGYNEVSEFEKQLQALHQSIRASLKGKAL